MGTTKVLDNFKPYNDIGNKGCFWHAFYPILVHFNKSIYPFISNDIFVYRYYDSIGHTRFCLDPIPISKFNTILDDLGIRAVSKKIVAQDILNELINSIDNKKPVIILIDCFYESIRPDTYEKEHLPHALLIYGYNNLEQTFHIIEHKYIDSIQYENRTISYNDIINCYNSYLNYFHNADKSNYTYLEFSLIGEYSLSHNLTNNVYISKYLQHLNNHANQIKDSLKNINLFLQEFCHIVFEEPVLKNSVDTLINTITSVLDSKNIERYCILKFFGEMDINIKLCDSIIANWSFIRGIIIKYKYSKIYNRTHFEKSLNKLREIYELEHKWYDLLFSISVESEAL
jgi:hypothetical protein